MPRYSVSSAARRVLETIRNWIASDNRSAARRWVSNARSKFQMLSRQPLIGEACDHIRPGLRFVLVGNHVVYYIIREDRVIIVRIVHSARDIGRIFPQTRIDVPDAEDEPET